MIGHFERDAFQLPMFVYEGDLPYRQALPDGGAARLPEDPWFLLGNYQLTLFAHVSGEYEMICGQRSWGRVNQGEGRVNSGDNSAHVTVRRDGEALRFALTGLNALAADSARTRREFGCGYASYTYQIAEDVRVRRVLEVRPSRDVSDGASAMLLTVRFENTGSRPVEIDYVETVRAHYCEIQFQSLPEARRPVRFTYAEADEPGAGLLLTRIAGHADDPLLTADRDALSSLDAFPPALFMEAADAETALSRDPSDRRVMRAERRATLPAGGAVCFSLRIGYTYERGVTALDNIRRLLPFPAAGKRPPFYTADWRSALPVFPERPNGEARSGVSAEELTWHAYTLEAMATYSEYYQETKIPQGIIYDYEWGKHLSARDNFQHGLPCVYYNPRLARSILRYMLKRTTAWGEIRLAEYGNGNADAERYFTSDQQLFFFLLLSEYLRVTDDYGLLAEEIACYPCRGEAPRPVWQLVRACFAFLRDTVGRGPHGLVRLLNSDWNDAVYYIVKAPYNNVVFGGESHMNSAMACAVVPALAEQFERAARNGVPAEASEQLRTLAAGMRVYAEAVYRAFMDDLGDRAFSRRMYFAGKSYGDENMFLEPQAYALLIETWDAARCRRLYDEMRRRVYTGEKLGAREQQAPEFEDAEFDKGSRENGGFWYALNGPVILGVNRFDPAEARRLLYMMSLENSRSRFPNYWPGYWSACDQVESSLIPTEGLPDQSLFYWRQPIYCAHPHAWILYCWYRLHDGASRGSPRQKS